MEKIEDFIRFRALCLENAESAITSAFLLQGQDANHISFHLATLALEEVGKVVIGWMNYNRSIDSRDDSGELAIDDHVKKIFWAFWWQTFGHEIINKEQMDEVRFLAKTLFQRRQESLYTAVGDFVSGHQKIEDDELKAVLNLTRSRVNLAKADEIKDQPVSEEMKKFILLTESGEKHNFIFGEESQKKLIELGNAKKWVQWLIEHFERESRNLQQLLDSELRREIEFEEHEDIPKWEIKLTILSALHSIRPKILAEHNRAFPMFNLSKGKNNKTLTIRVTLSKYVHASALWHYGFSVVQAYVIALNIASRGVFWWHTNVDLDKFYDEITDLENKKKLSVAAVTKLHWPETKWVLDLQSLQLTKLVNTYILKVRDTGDFEAIADYGYASALLAKNDIHVRFEKNMFNILYKAFKRTVSNYENLADLKHFPDTAYAQILGFIKSRDAYDKIIALGERQTKLDSGLQDKITLTEVLAIRQYLSIYLLTLAVRDFYNDRTIVITGEL